jgi:hypothetical protein
VVGPMVAVAGVLVVDGPGTQAGMWLCLPGLHCMPPPHVVKGFALDFVGALAASVAFMADKAWGTKEGDEK